jgi:hypothetical protein
MKRLPVMLMSICALTAVRAECQATAGAPQATDATFVAKVTQASRPSKVEKYGGRSAREFGQWLSLTVEVKPSRKEATIPLDDIRLTEGVGAVFPLLAIDCATADEPEARFLFLGDAGNPAGAGVFLLGKLAGIYQQNKPRGVAWVDGKAVLTVSDTKHVMFVEDRVLKLYLLFEPPAVSGPLELQFGRSVRIPVSPTGPQK